MGRINFLSLFSSVRWKRKTCSTNAIQTCSNSHWYFGNPPSSPVKTPQYFREWICLHLQVWGDRGNLILWVFYKEWICITGPDPLLKGPQEPAPPLPFPSENEDRSFLRNVVCFVVFTRRGMSDYQSRLFATRHRRNLLKLTWTCNFRRSVIHNMMLCTSEGRLVLKLAVPPHQRGSYI